jgi:hypothetical protein
VNIEKVWQQKIKTIQSGHLQHLGGTYVLEQAQPVVRVIKRFFGVPIHRFISREGMSERGFMNLKFVKTLWNNSKYPPLAIRFFFQPRRCCYACNVYYLSSGLPHT